MPLQQSEAARGGVAILAGDRDTTRMVYHGLKDHVPVRAVIVENRPSRLAYVRRRMRRLGVGTALGQLAFQLLLAPLLEFSSKTRIREITAEAALNAAPIDPGVVRRVDSANGEDALALLRGLQPKVVVVHGARILSRQALASAPAVFLNMHVGITPLYRGVHGGYWALATGHAGDFGVTVHLLDAGLDTGAIVAQARIRPGGADNFRTYPYLQFAAGLPLLRTAVRDALEGRLTTIPPPEGVSRLWSHPTLWGYVRTRLREGVK